MRRIEPHQIWVGNARDGRDLAAIYQSDLRAVVQVAMEEPLAVLPRELLIFRFPLVDGSGNDLPMLRMAIRSLSALIRDRVSTLVCCSAGMSRSPALVAAALAEVYGTSLSAALVDVTAQTPADVSPMLWNAIVSVMEVPFDDDRSASSRRA